MTTHKILALKFTEVHNDADGIPDDLIVGRTRVIVTEADTSVGFSYSYQNAVDTTIDVADNPDVYATLFDGVAPDETWEFEALHIEWGNSKAANLLIGYNGDSTYVIQLSGDNLPRITSLAELQAFEASFTETQIPPGPEGPGSFIDFASIPRTRSSENDRITGTESDDLISSGAGRDIVRGDDGNDTLNGGDGNDSLRGGRDDDEIHGDDGRDFLGGDHGNDTLRGGAGIDTLEGGRGDDLLVGGGSADEFRFSVNHGDDTIGNFTDDSDVIALDDALWTGTHGTLTVAEVISNFADERDGKVFLEINGNSIEINGITSSADLLNDITIF